VNLINYANELIEIITNHGWRGFLSIVFVFLIFILFFLKIESTFLYRLFVFFNAEKKLLRRIESLKRVSNNENIPSDIRELAKYDEIRFIASYYLKCNLSVNSQNVWAKLINFHKNKSIPLEIYKRAYSLFPVGGEKPEEEIGVFKLSIICIVTIFQTASFLFIGALGLLAMAVSLGIVGGDNNIKLTLFLFSYFIMFVLFLAFLSSGTPNYFTYRKVKALIEEYNQTH
jgi:hypothetical protein